jgi:hypothetical protein
MSFLLDAHMPVWGSILGILLSGIGALWCLYEAYKAKRTYGTMVRMGAIYNIASLKAGPVEVLGKVEPIEELVPSPWLNKPSVIYHFEVEEWGGSGGNGAGWHTYMDDWHQPSFRLKDDTGKVTIVADQGSIVLRKDKMSEEATEELKTLLKERYDKSTKGWIGEKKLRYTESFLEEGDKIYVYGEAKEVGGQWEIAAGKDKLIISEEGEADAEEREKGKGNVYIFLFFFCMVFVVSFLILGGFIEIEGLDKPAN